MSTDETTARRTRWKRYSTVMAAVSTAYALLVGVVFFVAPELVVPVAIGGGLAIGLLSSLLARRTRRRDPLTER